MGRPLAWVVCQHACLLQLTECRGVQAFGFSIPQRAKKSPLSWASQESRVPPQLMAVCAFLHLHCPALQHNKPRPQVWYLWFVAIVDRIATTGERREYWTTLEKDQRFNRDRIHTQSVRKICHVYHKRPSSASWSEEWCCNLEHPI